LLAIFASTTVLAAPRFPHIYEIEVVQEDASGSLTAFPIYTGIATSFISPGDVLPTDAVRAEKAYKPKSKATGTATGDLSAGSALTGLPDTKNQVVNGVAVSSLTATGGFPGFGTGLPNLGDTQK